MAGRVAGRAAIRPDPALVAARGPLPAGALTRFAPAPTGYLHLGHVANAIVVWALARSTGGRVLLRLEDHDRQRCRPEFEEALIEDLAWLGFEADAGPVRQSDDDTPYATAVEALRADGLIYGCDCSRATFRSWALRAGRSWTGPGCPGGCRDRGVAGPVWRVAIGAGTETWQDAALGPRSDVVVRGGDLPVRDRHGQWTYGLCVVVDDLRQGIGLVVRGQDLLDATAGQIRLGQLLGRAAPPTFFHHPLIRRPDGSKLSKSSGDTGVRELRAAGWSAEAVIEAAGSALAAARSSSGRPG